MISKEKSVYISIGIEGKPDEIIIGGRSFPVDGIRYLAIELQGGQLPRYKISTAKDFELPELQEVKGE